MNMNMNNLNEVNIETMAARIHGKPKKPQVQDIIKAMFAQTSDVDQQKKLAAIYKYFMPAIPKEAKTDQEWVFKATSKEATRPYLHFSYCDDENLVATDGHRLHYIPAQGDKGYQDQNGAPITLALNLTFPDYKRVIPTTFKWTIKVELSELEIVPIITLSKKVVAYVIHVNNKLSIGVNKKYLEEALNGLDKVIISGNGAEDPLYIDMGERKAVVMPCKI